MRTTLAREIKTEGTALHAGVPVAMTLSPAKAGSGILFRRSDKDGATIAARYDAVSETNLGTVIAADGVKIGVIEHLMAAVAGAGIDDLLVTLDGPEPPILDGDALSYFKLLEQAGTKTQPGKRHAIKVTRAVSVAIRDARITLHPADEPEYSYELDYSNTKAIGNQSYRVRFTRESFAREIAPARTFGFMKDLKMLNELGLGSGGRLDNFILVGEDDVINTELRFPDEFVRHKILDIIGDLYLLGYPIRGKVTARLTGHRDNIALLRQILG